jgi:hypothetical protein
MVPGREKFKLFSALKMSHFGRFPAGLGAGCAPLAGKNHGRAGMPALIDVNEADPHFHIQIGMRVKSMNCLCLCLSFELGGCRRD